MKNKTRWAFAGFKGLRYELAIAFGLVMVAILVFLGYLFPGPSSIFSLKTNLIYTIVIAFVIVFLAFTWIRQVMVNPVIKMSREAKKIADGDLTREITLVRGDEIGELGDALNRMTSRIRENMEELKTFGEKTELINTQINKRILTLSSLLQINNLISSNADLDEIIAVGMERCLLSGEMVLGCVIVKDRQTNEFLMRAIHGSKRADLFSRGMGNYKVKLSEGLLGKSILKQETIIIDKNTKDAPDINEFKKSFSLLNALLVPVVSRGKVYGLLIAGNDKKDYSFASTDIELLDLFSKQIAIAVENMILLNQVEKLEIIDSLTGLFNGAYIHQRLDEEIKRAISFQRPCAFVIITLDRFKEYLEAFGHLSAEGVLIKVGTLLKENISDVDKAARFGDHEFALILPERNKRQAIEVAEGIRKKIEYIFSEEDDERKRLTAAGAVTENPVDGVTADELISKGRSILESVKKQGGNRISYKV